jgi:hypothetical protein
MAFAFVATEARAGRAHAIIRFVCFSVGGGGGDGLEIWHGPG